MKFIRNYAGYIAAIVVVIAVLAVLAAGLLHEMDVANSNIAYGHKVIVATPEKVITVPPPAPVPSAEVVAQELHCKKFSSISVGGGVQGIVLDEGSCYIGHTKYAIDTFQNPQIRNTWLKMAEKLGVVPAFVTAHSVTYKSVTS